MTYVYLVCLRLQSIVKCPGLLQLLVELIHLLLVLFLQTLPLFLKLRQILRATCRIEVWAHIFKSYKVKKKKVFSECNQKTISHKSVTLWCCFSRSLVRCWCCRRLLSAFCLWHFSSSCNCFSLCSAPDAYHTNIMHSIKIMAVWGWGAHLVHPTVTSNRLIAIMIMLSWLGMCWSQRLHFSTLEWTIKCMKCTAISFKCICFHLVYLVVKVAKLINVLHLTTQHQQSINPVRAFRVHTKKTRYMWLMGKMTDYLMHHRFFH